MSRSVPLVSLEGEWPDVERLITRKDDKRRVWGPDQRVDRATALRIVTQNGANYVLRGDKLGSIQPGKLAANVTVFMDWGTKKLQNLNLLRHGRRR